MSSRVKTYSARSGHVYEYAFDEVEGMEGEGRDLAVDRSNIDRLLAALDIF